VIKSILNEIGIQSILRDLTRGKIELI